MRGSKTHGWGAMKKHRGAGSRGGRGMAGSGKRADTKKPTIIKKYGLQSYFGKHGFRIPPRIKKIQKAINISYLEQNINKSKKENDFFIVDLKKLGFDKLLSKGKPTKKFKISLNAISKKAKIKIEKAGGEIILPKQTKKE